MPPGIFTTNPSQEFFVDGLHVWVRASGYLRVFVCVRFHQPQIIYRIAWQFYNTPGAKEYVLALGIAEYRFEFKICLAVGS